MVKAPFSPPLGGASNSIHIAAGLDKPTQDAAWSFIAFLAQPEWQQKYTELTASPRRPQGAVTPEIAKAHPELVAINEAVIGAQSTTPANQALRSNYNEFNQIIQRTAVKVLSTSEPVADILKDAQAQLEQPVPLATWRASPTPRRCPRAPAAPGAARGRARAGVCLCAAGARARSRCCALVVYPLARVVEISTRIGRSMNFARIALLPSGTGELPRILADPAFWTVGAGRPRSTSAASVALAFAIGLRDGARARICAFPARRLFRTLLLLPWAVPGVVASIVFRWMFDGSFGVVNAMLRAPACSPADIPWFADGRTAFAAVMVPTVWKAYPLITLTLLAAMQTIPGELYEASAVDGASRDARGSATSLGPASARPRSSPMLVSALWIFRDIDIVYAATGGGPARATRDARALRVQRSLSVFPHGHRGRGRRADGRRGADRRRAFRWPSPASSGSDAASRTRRALRHRDGARRRPCCCFRSTG